jgi:hypothetical protein
VADIHFTFDNKGLIELMSQRGYLIAEGEVNKVNEMDQ